jgi:hypothetical protein
VSRRIGGLEEKSHHVAVGAMPPVGTPIGGILFSFGCKSQSHLRSQCLYLRETKLAGTVELVTLLSAQV